MRSSAVRMLVVFFANGLLHEYLASIMSGRVLGYPLAFFSLQGIAAAFTARWRPTGLQAFVIRSVTVVFMLACSALVLATVDAVVPKFQPR